MKKLLALFTGISLLCVASKAQYVNIPDTTFRNFLQLRYPGCFNASMQLDTTCAVITTEDSLVLTNQFSRNIISLDGLQYFKTLRYFNGDPCYALATIPPFPASLLSITLASNGTFTSLPNLPPGLTYLDVWNTVLTGLPPLPESLLYLKISNSTYFTSFPALPNNLRYLICKQSIIPVVGQSLPDSLKYLDCTESYGSIETSLLPPLLDTLICPYSGIHFTDSSILPPGLKYLDMSHLDYAPLPPLPASLKYLDCGGDRMIDSLPELPPGLVHLSCYKWGDEVYNELKFVHLPALPTTLRYLDCHYNKIVSLPELPPNLDTLICYGNQLASLPPLPSALINLYCSENLLGNLPTLPNTIQTINCRYNNITAIPALPDSLKQLAFGNNRVTTLQALPHSLTHLGCENNQLTILPELPATLITMYCFNNQITSIPNLPPGLMTLNCSNNRLSSLPDLPSTLNYLYMTKNNIYCLPKLPVPNPNNPVPYNYLQGGMDGDKIKCLPNTFPNLRLYAFDSAGNSMQSPPLCSPLTNVSQCTSFPVMAGMVFYDNNNNGIRDDGEPVKKHLKVSQAANNFSFTNSSGYYELGADSIGDYNISANPVLHFEMVPVSYNYHFSSYDTIVTGNFSLQADTVFDSLSISVIPVNWAARPGFSFPYLISYENAGTTILSPNISFSFDSSKLVYDSSTNGLVINNGLQLSMQLANFVPGQQSSFIAYFTINPADSLGDSLFTKAIITANSVSASDSNRVLIRGSFDPNDKQATPQLSPSQVAAGKYIDYTIRFQNTGTDTAFNVVLSDTLSSLLQASTLQLINTSHPCKVTVKGNIVFFEFLHILLPDSNINELKSHGFVSFRIKPMSNVAVNTNIPNKAAIYFDYNSPVITNTAITQIKNPVLPVPLRLLSFTAMWQNNNRAAISWNTTNEINVRQYNIEQSLNGSSFTSIGAEPAKGRQYNTYNKSIAVGNGEAIYLRLKMIDMDGQFSYSPVVMLRKNKDKTGFSILNNPATNALNIDVQDGTLQNTAANIIDAQGMVVKSFIIKQGSQTIDIKGMPAGVYYLRTLNGSSRVLIR